MSARYSCYSLLLDRISVAVANGTGVLLVLLQPRRGSSAVAPVARSIQEHPARGGASSALSSSRSPRRPRTARRVDQTPRARGTASRLVLSSSVFAGGRPAHAGESGGIWPAVAPDLAPHAPITPNREAHA